ncbi:MAG TPA: HAMP domain-containing protein [Planctomycetes bacterium]|nr:HAMP domain-containing protein [Planctomycetota bacterium]
MSLRVRILLAIVLVNLGVLLTLVWVLVKNNRRSRQLFAGEIQRVLSVDLKKLLGDFARRVREPSVTIKPILDYGAFDLLCTDALIVDNPVIAGTEKREGGPLRFPFIQVNPLGAYHRRVGTFSRTEVMAGIEKAMDERRSVLVREGVCMPIQTPDGRVVGGGWFLPRGRLAIPKVPFSDLLMVIGAGVLFLAGLSYFGLDRWVLRPLATVSDAASLLERGQLGTKVEVPSKEREFAVVAASLNRASEKLAAHEEELNLAVRRATEKARLRERELILSGRLAALGTLAAGIAHEINNPLGGMINAVQRLKKPRDPARMGPYLDLLEDGLDRIGKIVRRTLEFAPRGAGVLPFVLRDSIQRARDLAGHRLGAGGIRFEIEGGEDLMVQGDAHELTQVFLNLFLNSIDALEERAAQEKAEGRSFEGRIEVRIRAEDGGSAGEAGAGGGGAAWRGIGEPSSSGDGGKRGGAGETGDGGDRAKHGGSGEAGTLGDGAHQGVAGAAGAGGKGTVGERHEWVRVEVRDNGPGVPPDKLQRIFDPFFSTKGSAAEDTKLSTGLGMSIARAIVEQHGGTLEAESPAGGGFLVVLRLPRGLEEGGGTSPAPEGEGGAEGPST